MKTLILALLLVVFMFITYGNCKSVSKKSVQEDPGWWTKKKKTSKCCRLSRRYKNLLTKSRRANKQCKRSELALKSKIDGLTMALDSQQIVIREIPPTSPPITGEELNIRKDRVIRIFQETDFTKITTSPPVTTVPPPTTTTTPMTTTTTTITSTTPTVTTPTTTTTRYTEDIDYWKHKYPYKSKYYDEDEDENEEDEDESFLDKLPRERKRRMAEDETSCSGTCPQDQATILAGITGLPDGSTASFVSCKPSHQSIGGNLARGCTECHYQIELPAGFHPRTHRHVICPSSKGFCFGGLAKCAKSVVTMTVFEDTQNPATQFQWNSQRNIDLNKGCCCQIDINVAAVLGDGN